jgi:hypothetical protein
LMGDLDSLLDRRTRRVRELEAEVERLREELAGCEQEKALAVGAARGAEAELERLANQ